MSCKSGTLYSYKGNFRAQKCQIAALYSGVKLALSPNFELGVTNVSAAFLKKFPSGKVPAFESGDGVTLTESNAIAYYLSTDALKGGNNPVDRARVQQWLDFTDSDILPAACTWVFPCLGAMEYNESATARAKEDVKKAMKVLNNHFLHKTYLVGERITLADISLVCTLLSLYVHVMDDAFRSPFGNVTRWFNTLINQPHIKAVLGEVSLCKKMAQYDAKKFAELQKSAAKPKESEKIEEPAAPAKPKNPMGDFPAGSFDMDDFKRFYSNNDEEKSVPYFWEKFDKEHYSIWRCDYKYANELNKVFMSSNLIGGMFQRLDKLRKNAFASVCLFGEDKNSTISGIWVWRGHSLAFELCEDWKIDYSSYDWKKLDPTTEETKNMVNRYFKWEGVDSEGRKFNQGKIFK